MRLNRMSEKELDKGKRALDHNNITGTKGSENTNVITQLFS